MLHYRMSTSLLILGFALFQLFLFHHSYKRVFHSKNKITFIYSWGFIFGAFVWEDLLIFSLFHLAASLITLLSHDLRIGALFICVFWVIRASGETLYFFLQQFIVRKVYPHRISRKMIALKRLLGGISDQKCFIIMQVFQQTIIVTFATLLILLLKNWSSLPSWV